MSNTMDVTSGAGTSHPVFIGTRIGFFCPISFLCVFSSWLWCLLSFLVKVMFSSSLS